LPGCAEFDAAVIGAGPAGSAAAISLAKAGHRVLLLDRASRTNFSWGESLPPAANPLLNELGVSQEIMAADHLRSCGTQSAWGENVMQDTAFIRHPRGQGWLLDRAAFDAKLRSIAVENGAHLITNVSQLRFHREQQSHWKLVMDSLEELPIDARWIVDCSGRQSWFASRLGVKRNHLDRQVAIGGIFSNQPTSLDQDTATLVEAVPGGWWYTLRTPNGKRIVVYLTHPGGNTMQRARTKAGFLDLLSNTNHVVRRVQEGGYTLDHGPTTTVANSSRLKVLWGDGWTAAGDAAMAFDPLSSQGIFNALYSGVSAARAVSATLSGDSLAPDRYVQRLDAVFSEYMIKRTLFYSLERRRVDNHYSQTALCVGPHPVKGSQIGVAIQNNT
jgi:flavin-dependent dehydrogenase